MLRLLSAAIALTVATSASAMTPAHIAPVAQVSSEMISQAQYHPPRKAPPKKAVPKRVPPKKAAPPRHRFTPGSRHAKPPQHWRRYNARPRDWRTRGCIIVGPLWFCP